MSLPNPSDSIGERAATTYGAKDVLVITCSTLALYNSCELLALVFTTFRRRRGLYFWSLLLATFGVIPYVTGWILDYFDLLPNYVGMVLNSIGWFLLITGQSVVLHSRLHLVLNHAAVLRAVRWMIIANGCIWHTTMTVLLFTTTTGSSYKGGSNPPLYDALEKTQLTCFCVQEFTISGLYIWKILDILTTSFDSGKRRFMWHLFSCHIVIVVMDIALLAMMYMNHFLLEQGIKVVVYSVKLKLEFATLGKLVEFVQNRGGANPGAPQHTSGFVELSDRRPRTADKLRSGSMSEAVHLEDLGSGSGTSNRQASEQIAVTTRIDIEESAVESDELSTDQLYEVAVRQISRG